VVGKNISECQGLGIIEVNVRGWELYKWMLGVGNYISECWSGLGII